jgi:molybdopterin-containing oxidoreductase family iron-sulfur binding subunit
MFIDLKKCIGCYSCMIACKQEHFLPPGTFWTRILTGESGQYPRVRRQSYPVLCNHCKEAPCVEVCPTGASHRRADGIVAIDAEKCVGCRYCVIACPYQQRTLYEDSREGHFPGQGLTELEVIGKDLYPHESGTVIKCNFCKERIDEALKKGLNPDTDREANPACVNNCAVKARIFGDLDDPESKISLLIVRKNARRLQSHLGTEPSVYYAD